MNTILNRFWDKVDKQGIDDCWNWTGAIGSSGYGQIGLEGKIIGAHRLSWILSIGPILDNKYILHKCDNKLCVNPSHLYCGTPKDNMRDRAERNPVSPNLFGSGKSKFSKDEIIYIRKLKIPVKNHGMRKGYKYSERFIAKMFKVSQDTIHRIWNSTVLCIEGDYI